MEFHSEFEWGAGGKCGFGLKIVNGNTGCKKPPRNRAGGSLRLMWRQNMKTGRVYLHSYVYYEVMLEDCGDHFGKSYPTTARVIGYSGRNGIVNGRITIDFCRISIVFSRIPSVKFSI